MLFVGYYFVFVHIPGRPLSDTARERSAQFQETKAREEAEEMNQIYPKKDPSVVKINETKADSKEVRFSGKVEAYNTGCYVDAVCSVTIDGKKVITTIGWAGGPVGKLKGVQSLDDIKDKIGATADVYAMKNKNGEYTLYGSENYYIEIKGDNNVSWVKSPANGLYYPEGATIKEGTYLNPSQEASGNGIGMPYLWITYGDTTIQWGGAQSGCIDNEFGAFQYGVSTTACVKSLRADVGQKNITPGVAEQITTESKKIFGDFVLKNK